MFCPHYINLGAQYGHLGLWFQLGRNGLIKLQSGHFVQSANDMASAQYGHLPFTPIFTPTVFDFEWFNVYRCLSKPL